MFTSPASLPDGQLTEVLDDSERPLCLLPPDDILAQGLKHRAIAVLALDEKGNLLLRETPGPVFETTAYAPLQAGFARAEFAEYLLNRQIAQSVQPRELLTFKNGPATITVFTALFSYSMLRAAATASFLLSDKAEIGELAKRNLAGPLLLKILPHLS